MRSTTISAALLLGALGLVSGQTSTLCDPTKKTCPSEAGLGTTIVDDFTTGKSDNWQPLDGTTMTYDKSLGAVFTIAKKTDAPVLMSNKYIMFGKVTAVMKSAPGQGTVSSFILQSEALDEIDWEWLGSNDHQVQSNFFGKGDTSSYDRGGTHEVGTPIETYRTYAIDWTADRIVWSIDGATVRTLTYNDPLTHGGTRYPQTPMRVRMGDWIGCLDASNPDTKGTCEWAGGQIDLTKGPFNMYVKSVTVQDYGCGGDYTYSDMSGSYQSIKSSGKCDGKGTGSGSSSSSSSSSGSATQTSSSSTSSSGSSSASAKPTNSSNSTTAATTLTSVTASNTAKQTGASTTSTTPVATQTGNAANSRYGVLDMSVVALGLGLGYLVM